MAEEDVSPRRQFQIVRNGDPTPANIDWSQGVETVQKGIADALNARNVAFLLGAGCSSLRIDGEERGISTMQPLAEIFCNTTTQALAAAQQAAQDEDLLGEDTADVPPVGSPDWLLTREEVAILQEAGVELEDEYARNLERLMEVLHSLRFVSQRSAKSSHWARAKELTEVINKVQAFLWEQCTDGAFSKGDTAVRDLYEKFYRKLVLRDRSLPRPWVFTTNYDLFNETAMDRLGIPYANGFSGIIERRFNPSTFRYALAEQLDLSNRKWSAVDAFVYLCKLHGSISWTEDDHGLFPIREKWPADGSAKMMIFPTPAKQNSSLGSPYADLFREFQSRIVREQSVLVTSGYGFGDEHLNNIIYQALTIPTFRLIIFASPDARGEIAKLRALGDPRIWIIGGDGPEPGTRAHYFDTMVDRFMPQRPSERIDDAVRKVMKELAPDKDDTE
ncbi:SIR2 family protein [Mesorhizobium sp. M1380]|uniref:SIR2 family protein n=1 Tax=Mesorhizobium sp. M1380 TaxID=2957093 RepID=UPI003334CAF8